MANFLNAIKTKNSAIQLFRYALIGVGSNLAGYLVYLLIVYLGASPQIAMTLLYGTGAALGFAGNRNLTFAHQGSILGAGVRYFLAHCCGYLINLIMLVTLVERWHYPHQLAQAMAIVVVAVFLFLTFKFFVFKAHRNMHGETQ